jgi:hypothetical protein
MHLIRKVTTKEVKRCYVISGGDTHPRKNQRPTADGLRKELVRKKSKILSLTEDELDTIIGKEWKGTRLAAYDSADWYLGTVHPSEVGVWNRAGGLPVRWTNGSLAETAEKVKRGLAAGKLKNIRAGKVISNILRTGTADLQKEKYLFPIIFKGNTVPAADVCLSGR